MAFRNIDCVVGAVLLSLVAPSGLLAQFPPALNGDIPVSDRAYGAAPGAQSGPRAATANGMTLVAWQDRRDANDFESYASRIDSEGRVLDPLGIRVPAGLAAVGTRGDDFVVLGHTATTYTLTRVHRDGSVDVPVDVPLPRFGASYVYAAAASADGGSRFLFLDFWYGARYAVVNATGAVITSDNHLPSPPAGTGNDRYVAGSRGSDFLILRMLRDAAGLTGQVVADRLSADGTVLGTTESNLSTQVDMGDALVGGGDGYLFLPQPHFQSARAATAYHLNADGVFTSSTETIAVSDTDSTMLQIANVAWAGDRWILTWSVGPVNGHTVTYSAAVGAKGGSTPPQRVRDWVGMAYSTAAVRPGTEILFLTSAVQLYTSSAYDMWVERLTPAGGADLRLISGSCTAQGVTSVAAGSNGYAAAWWENGPDQNVHLWLRRLSPTGQPQDAQPIHLGEGPQDVMGSRIMSVKIASSGDTYLLVRPSGEARRLDAASGSWIDADPFEVGLRVEAEASNGSDVLVVSAGKGRVVPMRGDALRRDLFTFSDSTSVYRPAVASNGRDYLVVWSDGWRDCAFECILAPFRLLGMRVSAEGERLDSSPIVIDDSYGYPDFPTIAWAGDRYLVAWSDAANVRAARVTAGGQVLDPSGVIIDPGPSTPYPTLVAHGGRVALFARRGLYTADPPMITAADFAANLPLEQIAALPRLAVPMAHSMDIAVNAVARGDVLALFYNQVRDSGCGGVSRAVLRLSGDAERRRAVRH